MKQSGARKNKPNGNLRGSLCDLCASVVADSENDFTTEAQATIEVTQRNSHLRPSFLCIILAVFAMVSSVIAQQPSPTPAPRPGRSYSSDELPKAAPAPGPKGQSPVTFSDITAQTKISFKHQGSPTSQKYLLETMGGGVAIFDYDNDGRMDLFFTN